MLTLDRKAFAQKYGWHLDNISKFTYVRFSPSKWVRRSRAGERRFRVGGMTNNTAFVLLSFGLVKFDGPKLLRITDRGRSVLDIWRRKETTKQRRRYLQRKEYKENRAWALAMIASGHSQMGIVKNQTAYPLPVPIRT